MYTVYDVRRNSDTGFGVLGILCLLGTAGVAVWTFSTVRALRRFVPIGALRPKPSASAPASAREALLAVYDAGDALDDGTFPSWSMTYRYDPDLLERAFGQLDERLAAMPGLEPEIRAIPAELTHRVRAAKHEPLIGGVRLDPTPLHFELSRVWRRVGIVALR
jgi:hypothetical protein